jgi:hypothetical protein
MARDRFGFLERHGFVESSSGSRNRPVDTASLANSFLSRFAPRAGFVALRQTFVLRCHAWQRLKDEQWFGEQISA